MIIEPRVLKGFRDILPEQEMLRRQILRIIEDSCRRFGFVPIDTPILERSEVLLGKGGGETDKQLYHFEDHGGRDVAMRFDLTIPFARFMASHLTSVYLPFRRYHFAKVFRGENTQRGRYREFMQCDFDIVGVDSAAADFEILQLMDENFSAIGTGGIRFHISHRSLLNRFLMKLGINDLVGVLRIMDKRAKIGNEECASLLAEKAGRNAAEEIIAFIQLEENNGATLDKMEKLSGGESKDSQRMRSILELAAATGLAARMHLDPSITRGLDYYTGIVYETFLDDMPGIGSVCSGGRYNNLAGLYTKVAIPGVGSSIGLDRLMAALLERSSSHAAAVKIPRASDVLIFMLDEKYLGDYTRIAASFRSKGFKTEVYPEKRKLAQQFSYAEKKNIPIGILAGESEIEQKRLNYKNLLSRESTEGIDINEALRLASADLL